MFLFFSPAYSENQKNGIRARSIYHSLLFSFYFSPSPFVSSAFLRVGSSLRRFYVTALGSSRLTFSVSILRQKKGYTSCPMAQPKFLTWFSWFGSWAHLWTNYCDHSRMGCPDWPDLDRMLTLGAHVDQEQRRRLRMLYKKGKGDSV